MKQYLFEIIIMLLQLLIFYIFPLFSEPIGAIGMVLLIFMATFLLSLIVGAGTNHKITFLYPFITAILFIPSVFIYYNESALVHSAWYLVVSWIGLLLGSITKLRRKKL